MASLYSHCRASSESSSDLRNRLFILKRSLAVLDIGLYIKVRGKVVVHCDKLSSGHFSSSSKTILGPEHDQNPSLTTDLKQQFLLSLTFSVCQLILFHFSPTATARLWTSLDPNTSSSLQWGKYFLVKNSLTTTSFQEKKTRLSVSVGRENAKNTWIRWKYLFLLLLSSLLLYLGINTIISLGSLLSYVDL